MNRLLYFLALLFAIVKLTTPIPFVPSLSVFWNICSVGALALFLLTSESFSISKALGSFILAAIIGLAIMNPDPMFRSWDRLLAFSINVTLLAPVISSKNIAFFRSKLFDISTNGLSVICFASFIAYFLGINLADKSHEDVYWAFGGITSQSMLLAPCCALCFIKSFWTLLFTEKSFLIKGFHWVQIFETIWLLLVAGSRGTLIGVLLVSIVILFIQGSKKTVLRFTVFFTIVICITPTKVFNQATYTLQRKQQSAELNNSRTSSRDEKWAARLSEFAESPIWGNGFASQTHFTSDDDIAYITSTGGLEPGSSWLAILAMTGLAGFIPMCFFLWQTIRKLWQKRDKHSYNIYLLAIWTFFLIHGIFEGWILYAGNFIFYLFWIAIGHIDYNLHYSEEMEDVELIE